MNRKAVGSILLLVVGIVAIYAYKIVLPLVTPKEGAQMDSKVVQNVTEDRVANEEIVISIASSNTKEAWLGHVTAAFNKASSMDSKWQVDGRPIRVEIIKEKVDGKEADYRSGTMIRDTLEGKIQPTILSPGSESWIESFVKEWQAQKQVLPLSQKAPVVVKTPLVIAMWQSRAKALSCYPRSGPECSWQKIKETVSDPQGWGRFNRPEWGDFTFGYGAYGESNSGTMGILSMCMVGANKETNLKLEDVEIDNDCGKFVAAVENAKVHSGKSDIWLLERMISGGQNYLDAVITYESNVIKMNRKYGSQLPEPLVAVYPEDGTIFVGHPLAILDKVSWVTAEQVAAAKRYVSYLLDKPQQEAVVEMGLRPADSKIALGPPISEVHGADPQVKPKVLEPPEPLVMDRLGEVWHSVKKRAVIVIAFDKSGSMVNDSKIAAAKEGAKEFVKLMGSEDILVWLPFDSTYYTQRAEGPKYQIGEELVDEINAISAKGGTALYDTILYAKEVIDRYQKSFSNGMRYGLVVLSDGKDTAHGSSLAKVEAALMPQERNPHGIQIHTICIGADCDEPVLRKIANTAHGRFWKGKTAKDMTTIYGSIATHY